VEVEIGECEARMALIREELCFSRVASDYKKLIELEVEKKDLTSRIERLMEEWERLHAEQLREEREREKARAKDPRKKYLTLDAKKS
jgi:hypothetical protein